MKTLMMTVMAFLVTGSMMAQDLAIPTMWKVRKIGITMGGEVDMLGSMNNEYLLSTAKGTENSAFNTGAESAKDLDFYGGVCENPHIRLTAALEMPGIRNAELNVSAIGVFNRMDGAYYHNRVDDTYISYTALSNEIALEAQFDKRFPVLNNKVNLYTGAGTNIGLNTGGRLSIDGTTREQADTGMERAFNDIVAGNYEYVSNFEQYELKDGISQRVFAHVGIGVILFKKFELGFDYRHGIGYRAIGGADTKKTTLQSAGLSFKYILF